MVVCFARFGGRSSPELEYSSTINNCRGYSSTIRNTYNFPCNISCLLN